MSILFPVHDITWIPTRLLRSYHLDGLSRANFFDISVTRPRVITISIKSTSEPQSIVEEFQFTMPDVFQRIDKTYKSTTIKLTYKLHAITFRELKQQDSPDLTQFKTFLKCQQGKEIWYKISHKGDEHFPHGNLVTSHEVSTIPYTQFQLNCFFSKLRQCFKKLLLVVLVVVVVLVVRVIIIIVVARNELLCYIMLKDKNI